MQLASTSAMTSFSSRKANAVVLTIVGVFLFGLSPILLKLSGQSPVVGGVYRLGIPLIVYLPAALINKSLFLSVHNLFLTLFMGLVFGLNILLFYAAVLMIGAPLSSMISEMSIFWVGFFWMGLFRRRLPLGFWIGAIICLAGLFCVLNPQVSIHGYMGSLGAIVALMASLTYAIFLVINELGSRRVLLLPLLFYSHLAGTILLIFIAKASGVALLVQSGRSMIALVSIGVLSQACGFAAITTGQRHLSSPVVAAMLASEPLFTLISAVGFLGTGLSAVELASCVVVTVGAAFAAKSAASGAE